ncbi:MAG TPA: serine hydrolase domain-containing protein [Longimicrobiales bacterium]|nr:serine hydrolase domain-containing protein [Longimicrobiales bacterium]
MDSVMLAALDSIVPAAIADGATPGAAVAIGRHGKLVWLKGYGRTDWAPTAPEVTDSTLYDLASLTKPLATTLAAMRLVQAGDLDLDAKVSRYLRYWPRRGAASRIRIRHLLSHTSGLPPDRDLWAIGDDRTSRLRRLSHTHLIARPGRESEYSDVGMIVLGAVIERVTGRRLDAYLQSRVYGPLRLRETTFTPLSPVGHSPFDLDRIAPTEFSRVLGRPIQGRVHDSNADALGGVAGNAGLFSSVRDVAVLCRELLRGVQGESNKLARAATVRRFASARIAGRALGFDLPDPDGPFSRRAFGHTGYTGTSFWIDPARDLFVVLLTNRVDPSSDNHKHIALRTAVHDVVIRAVRAPGAGSEEKRADRGSGR